MLLTLLRIQKAKGEGGRHTKTHLDLRLVPSPLLQALGSKADPEFRTVGESYGSPDSPDKPLSPLFHTLPQAALRAALSPGSFIPPRLQANSAGSLE